MKSLSNNVQIGITDALQPNKNITFTLKIS